MFQCHGAPMAFSDKHSVFRVAKKDATGRQGMTPVQPCALERNIEITCDLSVRTEAPHRVVICSSRKLPEYDLRSVRFVAPRPPWRWAPSRAQPFVHIERSAVGRLIC
ncbi:hypothetical protein CN138_36950 [Sinorhizobium meliloti]|nr:hypothetical protein C3L21_22375 [Sinorhizobium meliloti]RVK06874.1 hypothetical protein CN164_25075 [Sinorhizobium meliloti]RVL37915.1 hypothetical protein CN145_37025 [Sinorhizobium meliloti]RVL58227.1 hypothetical protein CN138_36950 [Sinorhizobium meliloti]